MTSNYKLTKELISNFNSLPLNEKNFQDTKEKYYRLKVNINGFNLSDIKIDLIVNNKKISLTEKQTKEKINTSIDKVQIKIIGKRISLSKDYDSTNQFERLYDISSKSNIDIKTMRYFLDQKNPLYMIVEFKSNLNEDVFINLDESCESLVEAAAKSLLNISNIEGIRQALNESLNNNNLDGFFSTSLIKDINKASTTRLTEFNIIERLQGSKFVSCSVNIPHSIKTISLNPNSKFKSNDLLDDSLQNHLNIHCDGLRLNLKGFSTNENTTSTFYKEINFPKGSKLDGLEFTFDKINQILYFEAPFSL